MKVKLHHLTYYVAVAEEGSFSRAARRLQMMQPPLSRAVQQLEAIVGAKLLERTTREVRVTSAGAAMLGDAQDILGRGAG